MIEREPTALREAFLFPVASSAQLLAKLAQISLEEDDTRM